MAEDKKLVEAITSMDVDFAQWYTDVCKKAELMSYSSVKGCMIFKPAGYAIWENIKNEMDRRFKETGVENVYLPMFIPESLLEKEKDHVEGFAPEVAWVTYGGLNPLQERMCVRPTSETLFCDFYKDEIQSYRDLPKVYNQWCSVVRWEKETRPFLRSREFLWQEGHTAHATEEEAEARKRAAEQTTASKNQALEKKKEALQQKKAKWEKANAISQSIIATALAVSRALPNMVLAALVGALGAAQLATIIAQPIPKYAKGTDNHPGGLAIVGDGGKHEAVVTDRGAYITPNVPTLIDLPRRAKVIPDVDIERRSDFLPPFDRLALYRSMNLRSDIGALMKDAERMGEPITVNVNNDYRKLEREMQSLNRSFEKMAKYQKKAAKEAELRNISNRI